MNRINKKTLNELADLLILDLKKNNDFFKTSTIVFPNNNLISWFKAYWLKKEAAIPMNVSFVSLSNIQESLFELKEGTHIVNKEALKLSLINVLKSDEINKIKEFKDISKYYLDENGNKDGKKFYDFINNLSSLFGEYEKDLFVIDGYEKDIYELVINDLKKKNLYTLKSLMYSNVSFKKIERLSFFGFYNIDKLTEKLICEYAKEFDCPIYEFENEEKINKKYKLVSVPSKYREIEFVHSTICSLIKGNDSLLFNDFLVLAKDINEYVPMITRVFKQTNKDYPNVPFGIKDSVKDDSFVTKGIKLLISIYKKGFFSRLDFNELINNPAVMLSRDIVKEDTETFIDSVLDMNVYRDDESFLDWDYLKKRVLLSKISNINNIDNNVIEVEGNEYLPYNSISLNNDNIVKFINIIDDLNKWLSFFKDLKEVDKSHCALIKEQLDSFFSKKDDNDFETNKEYKKINRVFNAFEEMDLFEHTIPLETFLSLLIDYSKISRTLKSECFLNGVTFTNFNVTTIYNAKYVFFIGFNSNLLPEVKFKSELDIRNDKLNNEKEENAFLMQYQNTSNEMYLSYIRSDLKTDEELYPSSFLFLLADKKAKLKDLIDIKMDLDETRDWTSLYSEDEVIKKKYYDGLLDKEEEIETKKSSVLFKVERVSVKQISDLIKEPLSCKTKYFLGTTDDKNDDIHTEFEDFKLDHLESSIINSNLIVEFLYLRDINKILEKKDELFKKYKLIKYFPAISEKYIKDYFDLVYENASHSFNRINSFTNSQYQINKLNDLIFNENDDDKKWILTCNDDVCSYFVDNDAYYFVYKKMTTDDSIFNNTNLKDYMDTYVMALMDIATKVDKEYHVHIIRNKGRDEYVFNITPSYAKQLLEEMYYELCNLNEVKFFNLKYVYDGDKKIEDLFSDAKNDHGPWTYFKDSIFYGESKSLGYNLDKFSDEYKEMKERRMKYLRMEVEDGE